MSRLTPRQKWDAGIELDDGELDELLDESKFDEWLLSLLDEHIPRTTEQLAERVRRAPADVLLALRRLAIDPVWLAREVVGGWVSHDGTDPGTNTYVAPEQAMILVPSASSQSLAHDGGLGRSAYQALAPTQSAPAQPLMHLRTHSDCESLRIAIIEWGQQFAGCRWDNGTHPRILISLYEFLLNRFPKLTEDQTSRLCMHLRLSDNRISIDVPALHAGIVAYGAA